jgi:hypothetical protein
MSLRQTLFLGCSITKFNINLAWGEENSQARISLAYDDSTSSARASFQSDSLQNSLQNRIKNNRDIPTQNSYVISKNIPTETTQENKKRLWPTNTSSDTDFLEADPNFIGLNYDIIGCPARFKYDTNLEFAGLVKSWKSLGSTSGKDIYEVELQGYSSLLNNSYLIINNYIGSISEFAGDWASPMIYDNDRNGNLLNRNYVTPSIYHGNIPNVFNVYGAYEAVSFGSSFKNDRGIPALQIYNFLRNDFASRSKYNPYGGLITKTVTSNGNIINTDGFLENHGLCRSIIAADNVRRSLFSLDLSEVPVPPQTLYIPNSVISIGEFIKILCEGAGCDYSIIFLNNTSGNTTGTIKVKTISRRDIPSRNQLKNKINELINQNNTKISNYSYGQEFADTPVRLMHIGGKQKRLYQALSTNLSQTQTTMVFDPYKGTFMPTPSTTVNRYMVPDHQFTRRFQSWREGVGYVSQTLGTDAFYTETTMGNGYSRWQNNYQNVATANNSGPNHSYPIFNDIICPYFGMNGDTYSESGAGNFSGTENEYSFSDARTVYWDQRTNQLKIVFIKNDITRVLSNSYYDATTFVVLENELRAAGSGFESWLSYCFDNFFSTDIELLMAGYFRNTYGTAPYLKAVSIIKWDILGKSKASNVNNYAGNISIANAAPYVRSFYQDLNKVWEIMKKVHDTYYGKSYMVRVPSINYYRDPESGKYFYNWEVSTDGAWEENGTFIDDTMIVGSTVMDTFRDEEGKIKPILGFSANAEKSTKDNWLDTQLAMAQAGGMGAMHAVIQKEYRKFTSRAEANKYFYFPLEHDMDPSNYVYIKYVSPTATSQGFTFGGSSAINTGDFRTAQGENIPSDYTYKMYATATARQALVYINSTPRIILNLDRPIKLGGGKNECERSLAYTMMHDAILAHQYGWAFKSGYNRDLIKSGALLAWFLGGNARISADIGGGGISLNDTGPSIPIEPKAICPAFAAIPIQYNLATYGPWIDNPGYAGFDRNEIDNAVGSVKVEENTDLVPWNYGGMENLDSYVCKAIDNEAGYQQVHENGELGVVGIDTSIGLVGEALVAGGPLISTIVVDIGENGITSNYTLRTYTRKLGFFNKENTDRFKTLALENFKQRKAINDSLNATQNIIKANFAGAIRDSSGGDTPKQLRWSPGKILVGGNRLHVHPNSSVAQNIPNYSPDWSMKPYGRINSDVQNLPRYLGDIGLYETDEAPRELLTDYDKKAIMSLDGILSPISFYPIPYGSTYSITKYPRSRCPICLGTAKYSYKKLNSLALNTIDNFNTILNNINTQTDVDCIFCEPDNIKDKRKYASATPKETTPPYIIASGTDLTIISSNTVTGIGGISGNPIINYATLNPVLLTSGEFSCYQNRQPGDYSAHSIDTISSSIVAPNGSDSSLKLSYSDNINDAYDYIDKNFGKSPGTKPAYKQITGYPNNENLPANNMRFFGLRGPIMVHGWGYDTEGYPVPNGSGEVRLNEDGSALRDSDGNILYKNQTQNPDGSWTKPYKEHKFAKGWGQMPGTWPVGPIDLRWDDSSKVWTVGANYKNVWIQIEQDLVDKEPARGQIITDLDKNPLPSGLRRLVFVKDNLGTSPAPRGAQIYCKYNSDDGFYEPIYNRPFITSGVIRGASSVDIYQIYSTDNTSYRTTYKNPLGFNASNGDNGLFVYMDKDWVLQSYRC